MPTVEYYPAVKGNKGLMACFDMDAPWIYVKWKEPVTKQHIPFYEMSRIDTSIGAENRLVAF